MPYIVNFEVLKKRAAALDPGNASEIANADVGSVAHLVDRYPQIVPAKYASGHIEYSADSAHGSWLVEIDAVRSRRSKQVRGEHAAA